MASMRTRGLVAIRADGYYSTLCASRLSLISMPTYEFRCPLGHEFERFYRSIGTSEAQTACPECGQMAGRMMSVGTSIWYCNFSSASSVSSIVI